MRDAGGGALIFKPRLAGMVLRGEKTQTRRLVKDGEEKCIYQPPRSYAVQPGRGKKAIGRIRVVKPPEQQLLGLVSDEEAQAEGFKTRGDFFAYWRQLHGEVDPFVKVWVITFVRDIEHHYRLVAKSLGYTDRLDLALPHEPEAIDADSQDHYSDEAHAGDADRHRRRREWWEQQQIEVRLGELRREAVARHFDARPRLRVIERQLELLRQDLDATRSAAA